MARSPLLERRDEIAQSAPGFRFTADDTTRLFPHPAFCTRSWAWGYWLLRCCLPSQKRCGRRDRRHGILTVPVE
jgi:hypothetical protein